jgi:hypothetical protein
LPLLKTDQSQSTSGNFDPREGGRKLCPLKLPFLSLQLHLLYLIRIFDSCGQYQLRPKPFKCSELPKYQRGNFTAPPLSPRAQPPIRQSVSREICRPFLEIFVQLTSLHFLAIALRAPSKLPLLGEPFKAVLRYECISSLCHVVSPLAAGLNHASLRVYALGRASPRNSSLNCDKRR